MIESKDKKLKSGFAVIAGRSNAGKSTLLNALIGTKLAITTDKPQTTRHAIQGVLHDERGQIVFVDTPGLLFKKKDALTKTLNKKAKDSLEGVEVILYIADPMRAIGGEEQYLLRVLEDTKTPKILVINKIDLHNPKYLDDYRELADKFDDVVEVSALYSKHLKTLVNKIFEYLPEGEPIYPEFQLTNIDNKFWFAEIIREKIFHQMYQELPYNINVEVDEIETRPTKGGASNGAGDNNILYIHAIIEVGDMRYKKMIIGHGGRKIKEIGTSARNDLEKILGGKVFLDLEVEVDPRWMEKI
ncbi:GTPase Era [Candidatus Parcubacteria bacterium]|nr:GTPase Era [Patescibacteria group bacterium]MCG2693664.1 GTPase Era [Candidatus Parcubacteria bacterium]